MFNELLVNMMELGIITKDDVKRLTSVELMLLIVERTNGLLTHLNSYIKTNDNRVTSLDNKYQDITDNIIKDLDETVTYRLNEWVDNGMLENFINQTVLKNVNDRITQTNDALEAKKADKTTTAILQGQINNLVVNGTGDSNPEVVQARGTFSLLNDRLDKNDEVVQSVSEEVWEIKSTTNENGYIKTDGSLGDENYHITLDVISGEEYWVICASGWNLKPYVLLNSSGSVVSYYTTEENNQVWHTEIDNILKVRIPNNVTKLVVNSMDSATLKIKKCVTNQIKPSSIKELPAGIVGVDNLSPLLSELYGDKYSDVEITMEVGFMQTSGSLNAETGKYAKLTVTKGEKYRITTNYGYNMRACVLLNADGGVVEYEPLEALENISTNTLEYEIKVDGYLYINTYEERFTSVQKLSGYKIADGTVNLLNGKKAIFFGDSITEGKGSWADASTIRGRNDMTGYNHGVGGSKYTVKDDSNDVNCIYLRIKSFYGWNADADYIILSGLVNDALQGMAIGTMLDKTDFTTECDTSTVYGAYEMAIRYTLEQWKGKKVGVIITPNIPSVTNLNDYFDVARNVCQKYSVPYLDLFNESGLCAGLDSIKATYYKGDDIHPNELGYEKYINDKVDAFMKSL